MCANNLSNFALDSAVAGIEPTISSLKSNALTTTPPSERFLNRGTLAYETSFQCHFSR